MTVPLIPPALRTRPALRFAAVLVVSALIALIGWLVYATGGIKYVFSHSMYVPIVLSAAVFGARGGIAAALAGGFVLGPFMPIDTATGELQATLNWIYRTGFFALVGGLCGILMSSLHRQLEIVRHQALHDSGTGFPNKNALLQRLSGAPKRLDAPLSLAVFHLNNYFDVINTLSVDAGEELLCEVVRRVRGELSGAEAVCQIQADQFALLLPGVDKDDAMARLGRIRETLKPSFPLRGVPVYVDTSIGLASCPHDDVVPMELMQKANIALDRARGSGRALVAFEPSLARVSQEQLALLGEIPTALSEGQLLLHYQPKIALETGEVVGVEALLRWNHPVRGIVPPDSFIPHAEKTGLIHDLTRWVVATSVRQLAEWQRQGHSLSMAVNISVQNFLEADLATYLQERIASAGIDPRHLELEITESAIMEDIESTLPLLASLKDLGVKLSIDDFGTGHSSLAYLKHLPVDVLKIDRAFIRGLTLDRADRRIVSGAILMAHGLGLQTVAEGIEDEETAELLRQMGCEMGQGYHFSRPQPVRDLERWLGEWSQSKLPTPKLVSRLVSPTP